MLLDDVEDPDCCEDVAGVEHGCSSDRGNDGEDKGSDFSGFCGGGICTCFC